MELRATSAPGKPTPGLPRPGEALHRGRPGQRRRRSWLSNRPVVLCRRAGDQHSGALRQGERVNGSGPGGWISMRYASAARNHRQPHSARCAIHHSLSVRIMHNIRLRKMAMESYSTVRVMCGAIYAFYGKKRRSYEEEVGGAHLAHYVRRKSCRHSKHDFLRQTARYLSSRSDSEIRSMS